MDGLKDRVALVTGGAAGIGRAIALKLAREGSHVAILDLDPAAAARTAHQLGDLSLADQTVVWGHSQGGHAALWAGQLVESYAPDDRVVGVAALAPASDLTRMVSGIEDAPGVAGFPTHGFRGKDLTPLW